MKIPVEIMGAVVGLVEGLKVGSYINKCKIMQTLNFLNIGKNDYPCVLTLKIIRCISTVSIILVYLSTLLWKNVISFARLGGKQNVFQFHRYYWTIVLDKHCPKIPPSPLFLGTLWFKKKLLWALKFFHDFFWRTLGVDVRGAHMIFIIF